jgi:hypothetical protein
MLIEKPARCVPALLLCGFLSQAAAAHECWLELSDYRPVVGSLVSASIRVGQRFRGDSMPYLQHWTKRLSVTGPDGERPAQADMGDDPAARFRINVSGSHVLAWESERFTAEIPTPRFEAYVEEAGLEHVVAGWLRERPDLEVVREKYYRYPKALLASGLPGTEAMHPLGMRLELVPLSDPYAQRAGSTVPFRVLFDGQPLAGARVIAFTRDKPENAARVRTGKDGVAAMTFKQPGLWLVNVVWLLPADEAGFDWQSLWASLTFQLDP